MSRHSRTDTVKEPEPVIEPVEPTPTPAPLLPSPEAVADLLTHVEPQGSLSLEKAMGHVRSLDKSPEGRKVEAAAREAVAVGVSEPVNEDDLVDLGAQQESDLETADDILPFTPEDEDE